MKRSEILRYFMDYNLDKKKKYLEGARRRKSRSNIERLKESGSVPVALIMRAFLPFLY
jgi:hypothetical protein